MNNSGVVASDTSAVGTARSDVAACSFGSPTATQGLFVYGTTGVSNIVNTSGVVASDVSLVGTNRRQAGGCEYGADKGIIAYGYTTWPNMFAKSNLISNSGVVASDGSAVGTARYNPAGASFGT